MSKKQESACCVYDFTLFDIKPVSDVRSVLKSWCKSYCFQLEKGEKTEVTHYQGRFSLKEKARKSAVIKNFSIDWEKFHITVTSVANRDNNFYVMKEATRVDGPFTDSNEVYVPRDIQCIKQLHPWQSTLRDTLKEYSHRKIDIVYDPVGNRGKSTFTRWMMCYEDADLLPCCYTYNEIMRAAYGIGFKKIYLVDMPRALSKKDISGFVAGLEMLKSGFFHDDRYKYRRCLIDPPRVCVFTNKLPKIDLLSKDRWVIWCIDKKNRLVDRTSEYVNTKPSKISNDNKEYDMSDTISEESDASGDCSPDLELSVSSASIEDVMVDFSADEEITVKRKLTKKDKKKLIK